MPKLFIVEGADCTGKSTLATNLAAYTHAAYIHASGHRALHPGMMAYHDSIIKSAEVNLRVGNNVVLDRHWPSEWCYGSALRAGMMNGYSFGEIMQQLYSMPVSYVMCFSKSSCDRQIASPDKTHPYTRDEYFLVYRAYEELYDRMVGNEDSSMGRHIRHSMSSSHKVFRYEIEREGVDMDQFIEEIR